MASVTPPRVIVMWCIDWPLTAARGQSRLDPSVPLALVDQGRVLACSPSARSDSVRRGQRTREAQARCPDLVVLPYDSSLDARAFEPLVRALEDLTPGVQVLRPGLCAVRVRGAARYYGGERPAALALAARLTELGAEEVRAGVADGLFTAELAARRAAEATAVIPPGEAPAFLGPLDIGVLAEATADDVESIVTLLRRLGIRTLGEFAHLGASDVRARFGALGARLHELASGSDSWPVIPRTPPDDVEMVVGFDTPLEIVDQVAFAVRAAAESFIDVLVGRGLVATAIRVRLGADDGSSSERVWAHPRSFTPSDLVDRVRWQAAGASLSAGIVGVEVAPEAVDALSHHEPGLWGQGPHERVHHGISRVQSLLGHDSVVVPALVGGRTLADRQRVVAWGDRPVAGRSTREPWPGHLASPLPATVFVPRRPLLVLDAAGHPLAVTARGIIDSPPTRLVVGSRTRAVTAWAGPWPLDERWWDRSSASPSWRFQVIDETGSAWLLSVDQEGAWAEGRYD